MLNHDPFDGKLQLGDCVQVMTVLSIPFCTGALVATAVDLYKQEVYFKFFPTVKEADNWRHEMSLKQLPDWHKENCGICRARIKEDICP